MGLYIFLVVLILFLGGIGAMIYITYPISKKVYQEQLVKTSDNKWIRECSASDNEEQISMWKTGIEWAEPYKVFMKEVCVENDGLKLYGEFYDFGSDKCVIILPGRCECLMYSYYFAKPYKDSKMNILVIDSRGHGKSEGKYSSVGLHESDDVKVWISFLVTELGIKSVWLHGICIGSAAALLAVSSGSGCENVKGIVLEGCFVNFRESFKQHMIDIKKPWFPVLDLVMYHLYKNTGINVIKNSPFNAVKSINCPILFLFGEKDKFSLPEKSRKLYEACSSPDKRIVWFDEGGHSHLRINNTEKYDKSIMDFVADYEK